MELIYRFEATLEESAIVGPVAAGIRFDIPFSGQLVAGEIAGGRGWGSDYLLQRNDGIAQVDAQDTFELPGGEHLHARAQGFVVPPEGVEMPSIEEMLSPDFAPADVRMLIDAFAICETGSQRFGHLNRTLVKVDGWVNNATGELVLEGRRTAPSPRPERMSPELAVRG